MWLVDRIAVAVAGAVAVAAVALFAAIGVLLSPAGAVLGVVVVGVATGAATMAPSIFGRLEARPPSGFRLLPSDGVAHGRGVLVAACTVAGLLVLCGMAAVMGSATGPVALATVLLIGLAWWWRRERARGRARRCADDDAQGRGPLGGGAADALQRNIGSGSAGEQVHIGARGDVVELSDEELCLEWRRSFVVIEHLTDPRLRDHLSGRRRGYLDELERRHPVRFAQWLAAGARAASDPARFVTIESDSPSVHRREAQGAEGAVDSTGTADGWAGTDR